MLELESVREHEVDSNLSNRRDSREKRRNFNLRDNIVRVRKSISSLFPQIYPCVKFDACDVFCRRLPVNPNQLITASKKKTNWKNG